MSTTPPQAVGFPPPRFYDRHPVVEQRHGCTFRDSSGYGVRQWLSSLQEDEKESARATLLFQGSESIPYTTWSTLAML